MRYDWLSFEVQHRGRQAPRRGEASNGSNWAAVAEILSQVFQPRRIRNEGWRRLDDPNISWSAPGHDLQNETTFTVPRATTLEPRVYDRATDDRFLSHASTP